jgi:hypothetical protein
MTAVTEGFLTRWAREHRAPGALPTAEQIRHAEQWDQLLTTCLAVLDQAPAWMSENTRTAILADALAAREFLALRWCVRCKLTRGGDCPDHIAGLALVDEARRHIYRRLPGRPLIEIDLGDEPRHLRLVQP